MNKPVIPFIKPSLPSADELSQDISRIKANNYYSNNGPIYYEFKAGIEQYLNTGLHAVVVSNATLGLMMAVSTVFGSKKQEGKRYIAVPSFTFAAAPLAIQWAGYEPLFFDIDKETCQPSLESFKNEVLRGYAESLAGVILTNTFGIDFGSHKEWEEVLKIAGVEYIVDSAPGFGSAYEDNSPMGSRGVCEIFSFHATKPFGIGEGGLITTRDAQLAKHFESQKNFGFGDSKEAESLGINAKITELDCAIGLRLLGRFDKTLSKRRETYKAYRHELETANVNFVPGAERAAIQFAALMVDSKKRSELLSLLAESGVEARTYYAPPVHTFPQFKDCERVGLQNTEEVSKMIVSLPVLPDMANEDIKYICNIIKRVTE